MRLLIEEEYGYRQWVWTPQQETTKDLVNYWLNLDPNFFDSMVFLSPTNLIGIWQELKVPIGATFSGKDHDFGSERCVFSFYRGIHDS